VGHPDVGANSFISHKKDAELRGESEVVNSKLVRIARVLRCFGILRLASLSAWRSAAFSSHFGLIEKSRRTSVRAALNLNVRPSARPGMHAGGALLSPKDSLCFVTAAPCRCQPLGANGQPSTEQFHGVHHYFSDRVRGIRYPGARVC
jgi:hypothetical protein